MITSYFAPKKKSPGKRQRQNGESETFDNTHQSCSPNVAHVTPDPCDKIKSTIKRNRVELSTCPKVQQMLSYLHCTGEQEGVKSWTEVLHDHIYSEKFRNLANFVAAQRMLAPKIENGGDTGCVYPPPDEVFSALNLLPLHKVKVVIVGQDPYHQYNQGHGLAFSVKRGVKIPPSLRNIYKELLDDPEIPDFNRMPNHGFLQRWSEFGGVLLLNAVLTVRHGEANSHAKKGWEEFTDAVIEAVVEHFADRGVVFLLWGKPASAKAEAVLQRHKSAKSKHVVICTSHPSPLGATKTNQPFLTSRCFSRANKALTKMGMDPIDWRVDP